MLVISNDQRPDLRPPKPECVLYLIQQLDALCEAVQQLLRVTEVDGLGVLLGGADRLLPRLVHLGELLALRRELTVDVGWGMGRLHRVSRF